MRPRHSLFFVAFFALLVGLPLTADWPTTEKVDLDAVYRIKDEGLQRSKVMEIASYLTDVYGPRLTGSPNIKEAADWAQKTMNEWGLANVHREGFPFGSGWLNHRFVALALTPRAYPLVGYPEAWTPGTNGLVTGEAVMVDIQSDGDFAKFRGTLQGKFVFITSLREVQAHFEAPAHRFTDAELADLAKQPRARGRGNFQDSQDGRARVALEQKKRQFWFDEGVAAVVQTSRGDGGTFFVVGQLPDPKVGPSTPRVILAVEHYGRIARTLEKKIPVTLQMDIDNKFYDDDLNAFNIVAEIPGSDKSDEIVMIGAHFDSWHSGTGATDNAAGSAIMMEAMRILKTTGLRPRRAVRLALWGGEEEGHFGSIAYVQAHFADRVTTQLKPEHAKLSVYFNLDNGTGTIRGVYLQGNESVAPIFQNWMEPFKNLGMSTLAIRGTGGTDHTSFDAVGLPGFQFIQDPVEYDSRTHHSNQDVYERLQADDMVHNAVIIAAFAYSAANREDRLPRKPLPQARPTGRGAANQQP